MPSRGGFGCVGGLGIAFPRSRAAAGVHGRVLPPRSYRARCCRSRSRCCRSRGVLDGCCPNGGADLGATAALLFRRALVRGPVRCLLARCGSASRLRCGCEPGAPQRLGGRRGGAVHADREPILRRLARFEPAGRDRHDRRLRARSAASSLAVRGCSSWWPRCAIRAPQARPSAGRISRTCCSPRCLLRLHARDAAADRVVRESAERNRVVPCARQSRRHDCAARARCMSVARARAAYVAAAEARATALLDRRRARACRSSVRHLLVARAAADWSPARALDLAFIAVLGVALGSAARVAPRVAARDPSRRRAREALDARAAAPPGGTSRPAARWASWPNAFAGFLAVLASRTQVLRSG